jgi:hypothetical protein
LRIGNWFKSNIYQQVTIEHLEFLLNDSIKDKSIMQPIPLTEDILVKCGATYKQYSGWKQWNINGLSFNQNGNGIDFRDVELTIYHLHTLQNLIFALTGEELNIIL